MNHYEVLGVSPDAGHADIQQAYRQRLAEVEKDAGPSQGKETAKIVKAGRVLLTAQTKTKYDRRLAEGSTRPWLVPIAAILGIAVIAGAFFTLRSTGNEDIAVSTESVPAAATEASPTTAPTATEPSPTETPSAAPTETPTAIVEAAAAPDEVEEEQDEEPAETAAAEPTNDADLPDLADLPERGAIYRAPTLFLVGAVPSQELADAFYAKAVAVIGEENVVNEYVIHPDAPTDLSGNVRVEQAIQFETSSAVVSDQFLPVLGLALQVLTQNPQASLVVEGHTDSIGDPEANQVLSEARAQAVIAWLADRGVPSDRLQAVGFGESQPIEDNVNEAGRSINRRIEVQIIDLLS